MSVSMIAPDMALVRTLCANVTTDTLATIVDLHLLKILNIQRVRYESHREEERCSSATK